MSEPNTKIKNTKVFYNTQIPGDWEIVEIGEIINYKKGFAFKNEDYKQYGIRIIRVSDTNAGGIRKEGNVFLDYSRAEEFNEWAINENDIIIQTVGSRPPLYDSMVGKAIIVKKEFDGSLLNQNAVRIRIIVGHNVFLYAHLKTKRYFDFIETLIRGNANQVSITLDDLFKFKIPLPPLSEQKSIAQVLSTADASINITEKLIDQKELRKKWLMQQLLAGKKRLKVYANAAEGKKRICGEWKKERLERYLVKHDEKSKVNNQYPVLTSSRRGIFLQSDYYTRNVASEDNTGYNVVPRGYFTYRHMSDDLIFKFNINDIVDRGIVSTLYPVFTTKDINSYFLLIKLNEGSEFKMHTEEQKQGGSRTYVYFKTLCQLKLNLPSIEEQNAIAKVLQVADKEIGLLKAKADKLREQKKGIMQVLLTGKKRLLIKD